MAIDPAKLLEVRDRREWRAWLRAHHKTGREIWLVYFKKRSGRGRISYNDAVEEALCFGWIDSTVKRVDEERMAQRFSPRNPKTPYSQANRERLRELVRQRKVLKEVLATLPDLAEERFEVPADILEAIRTDREAWKNFRKLSPSYVRIRIGFIEGARNRPQEFQKRLRYFIKMTGKNKLFGFGGIEKYY
jgi:uncharacterized protein YdeI (YjbR/CyaY-like superfamily)